MAKNGNCRIDFLSPLSVVKGLGPQRLAALQESNLVTIGDLLYRFPLHYIDRSAIVPLGELHTHVNETCTCIGTISQSRIEPGRKSRFRIQVSDDTGSIEAVWFSGLVFLQKSLSKGKKILLHGKVQHYQTLQMVHPHTEFISEKNELPKIKFLPQYSLSQSMREHGIAKTLFSSIQWILTNVKHYPRILPAQIEETKGFPDLAQCLKQLHIPDNLDDHERYFARIKYEELYQLCLSLRMSKRQFARPGRAVAPGDLPEKLQKLLPFSLTEEQNKAIGILYADAASPLRMHRLLQGDVGCGKTIVALFACLPALHNNLQVAWLAPTEILAQQTQAKISQYLTSMDIPVALLTGSIPQTQKKELTEKLAGGAIKFVVGTHALIQERVFFNKLGMIVIDEQHKFGAQQRLALQEKDTVADFLLMSATPIPQSLAKTLYGDLDLVTIQSLPASRKPVGTHLVFDEKRTAMLEFVKKELLENNSQAFYVVPRIVGTSPEEPHELKTIESIAKELQQSTLATVPTGIIHGKLDSTEKERIMQDFVSGTIKLLLATTVIEVGIDVPNATIMIIEHADRFGLSQLHQLRGRVGRGEKKSYTFLLSSFTEGPTVQRLKKFCPMHDGFAIADMDLSLRGPGEVSGFRQSGWDELQFADIIQDADTFREIQSFMDSMQQIK